MLLTYFEARSSLNVDELTFCGKLFFFLVDSISVLIGCVFKIKINAFMNLKTHNLR